MEDRFSKIRSATSWGIRLPTEASPPNRWKELGGGGEGTQRDLTHDAVVGCPLLPYSLMPI